MFHSEYYLGSEIKIKLFLADKTMSLFFASSHGLLRNFWRDNQGRKKEATCMRFNPMKMLSTLLMEMNLPGYMALLATFFRPW